MPDVFPIAPASARALWLLGAVCVFLLGLAAALGWTAWSTRHSRVEVRADRVRLVGDWWGRSIPIDRLDLDTAAVVDLDAAPELAPRRRTWGTGLPGYAAGWFRLRSGAKALVYLTRRRDVLHVPTRDGYALLLSAESPQGLLDALCARARGGTERR